MSVRHSADPYDGFKSQLLELRGLVKIVPPLIEADRLRRWAEIETRPGDPEAEVIDIFETEAGEEEGYGFASYDRALYSTAIVTSWETFHFYCVRTLAETCLRYNLKEYPTLAQLAADERQRWDRSFDAVKARFKDFADVRLDRLPSWEKVLHAHELRNALVHNLGYYTTNYVKRQNFRRIEAGDICAPSPDKDNWVNSDLIPLDCPFAEEVIDHLIEAGEEIRKAVNSSS
jgi:hypothetical protein